MSIDPKDNCRSYGIEPERIKGRTLEDGKKVYKAKILLFHPDKNLKCSDEASVKFRALNQFYDEFKNLSEHDRTRLADLDAQAAPPARVAETAPLARANRVSGSTPLAP